MTDSRTTRSAPPVSDGQLDALADLLLALARKLFPTTKQQESKSVPMETRQGRYASHSNRPCEPRGSST
jgi:hypothetical protein